MLISGQLMLADGAAERRVRLEPGWLRVAAGRIADLGTGDPPGQPDLGDDRTVVCPGFVDTHLHLPQFDSIGADGLPLLTWLDQVVFPAEARWADADFAGAMASRAAQRLLGAGTTTVAAYATVHAKAAAAASQALAAAGLRGFVGQVLMDQGAPAELLRPAPQLLEEAGAAMPVGRIEPAITPRFAVSCSRELLAGAGRLAQSTGRLVQTHLSETPDELALVDRLHGGPSYTDIYERAGLLGSRTILGHGIWLSDPERATLRKSGAVISHCPTANLFLQAGTMDLTAHRAAGVRVGLGSDVAGGPDVSMPRVARAMIDAVKMHRLRTDPAEWGNRPIPAAAEAWWQITAGNAAVLGLEDSGRLVAGAPADLVIVQPELAVRASAGAEPGVADALSEMLYRWDDRWITRTLVEGRIAYSR